MTKGLVGKLGGFEEMARSTPDQKVGRPEDIAGTVVFLCSRASNHINGTTIMIDGGKVWGKSQL